MMNKESLVSILVVTWNRCEDLQRCLESALKQTYVPYEIVVVDNASSDGTVDMLREKYPSVRLIQLNENIGCPSARNVGIKECSTKYVYCLDDDGWLSDNAIELSVNFAEEKSDSAVVMSKIAVVDNGSVIKERYEGLSEPVQIPQFVGCCVLMNRERFLAAGSFPDDFFRQREEEDFSLRALDRGYKCYFLPESVMYHEPSPIGRNSQIFIYYLLRNGIKTGIRTYPFPYSITRVLKDCLWAVIYSFKLRYPSLLWKVIHDSLISSGNLFSNRAPVKLSTYKEYRLLHDTIASKEKL